MREASVRGWLHILDEQEECAPLEIYRCLMINSWMHEASVEGFFVHISGYHC